MIIHPFFKTILLPFSWLYGAGVYLRNLQFDLGIRKGVTFSIPLIVIGNLSAGGTGKTPMIEYLLRRLQPHTRMGVLSRGYKRRTHGYLQVDVGSDAEATGDEPLLIKQKFPDSLVAVSESRTLGVASMLQEDESLNCILLDDAFQHRQVTSGFNVVLTAYNNPYSRDVLLPAGTLREPASGAKRSQAIVVTKCPATLSGEEKKSLCMELKAYPDQPVFFSSLSYREPYLLTDATRKISIEPGDHVLLFCGIANPEPLVRYLDQQAAKVQLIRFADHHVYTLNDFRMIRKKLEAMEGDRKILMTTEKDAVKLRSKPEIFNNEYPEVFSIPAEVVFLGEDGKGFDDLVTHYLTQFAPETPADNE